jgi:hypothetical protein
MRIRLFLLVTVVAGLALLAAACGGGGGGESAATATPTPSAGDGGELTAEQAIQGLVDMLSEAPDQHPDPSTATARRMAECEAIDMMGWEGAPRGRPPVPPSEDPVWLVEVRGEFSGFIGYGLTPDPSPPRAGRWIEIVRVDGSVGGGGAGLPDKRQEEGPELSQERIIERALLEIDIPESDIQGGTATASRTTYSEALEKIQQEGAPQDIVPREDAPVWLVEVAGDFADPCHASPRSGKYLLILALDGFLQSSGFIPAPTPSP